MKDKVSKFMSRIIDTQKVSPLSAAVIVAVIVATMTLLSFMAVPICALAVSVYFLVRKLNEKNDTIRNCDRAYEQKESVNNIKKLFADALRMTVSSCENKDKLEGLIKYALEIRALETKNGVSIYCIKFPIEVFQTLEFGTWGNLKDDMQHTINVLLIKACYNISAYTHKGTIIENTVRLLSLSTNGKEVIASLFVVNNSASHELLKSLH